MDNYAIVKDGKIVRTINNLPCSFKFSDGKTTGDFHKMPVNILIENGYYPIEVRDVSIDTRYQVRKAKEYVLSGNKVIKEFIAQDINVSQMKKRVNDKIDALLQSKLNNEFTYGDDKYHLTSSFINMMDAMATHISLGGVIPDGFLLFNTYGDPVKLNVDSFKSLHSSYAQFVYGMYKNANKHKSAIEKITTSKGVVDYDYKSSW